MTRTQWLIGSAIALVAAGIVITVLELSTRQSATPAHAATVTATPPPPAPPLSAQRASILSHDLESGKESDLWAAIAVVGAQPLDPSAAGQLAATGPITFDPSTFHDNRNGTATVTAHVTHPPAGSAATWTVELVDEAGQWKLSSTDATP